MDVHSSFITHNYMAMENIYYEGQVMWAQVDANNHLRHSAYADMAAQARLNLLNRIGLTFSEFSRQHMGTVLFREELIYLREIRLDDYVQVTVALTRATGDYSRFSFRHEIYRFDGTKSAVINVDGAWIDTQKRKLTPIPEEWKEWFTGIPRSADFEMISR